MSESTPETWAFLHGLKAVYVPHLVLFDFSDQVAPEKVDHGDLSPEELDQIHCKMETLLGQQGAYLDAIYYCPHHPDKGYPGERPELKIECTCRKPKPGMLLQAAQDLNIDLTQSWMVGDGKNDVEAGRNAGCQTAWITSKSGEYGQTVTVPSLKSFVEQYLKT